MQERLQPKLREIVPTVSEQTNATRGHKRTLAEMTSKDGDRLELHTRQSNFIDLTGLGGAAASPTVRTAGRVAAVLQDEGSSHPAARTLGAFAADAAAYSTGGSAEAVRGPLGYAVEEGGREATVLASLEEAFKNAPTSSTKTCSGARSRNEEAGLSGGRSAAVEEVLGSSSPFLHVKGEELKRAAQRYVALPDCPELSRVKAAMEQFIGPGRTYTGASFTCRELTREYVCRGGRRGIRQCGVSSTCGGESEHGGRPPKSEEAAVGDTALACGCSVDKGDCRKWSGRTSSGTVPDPQIDPSRTGPDPMPSTDQT